LRRSKKKIKETLFKDDFYTYLIENNSTNFLQAMSALKAKHWDKNIRLEIDYIKKK